MDDNQFDQLTHNVQLLRKSLGSLPLSNNAPVLIVLSGLPGTGKSYFSHQLMQRLPLVSLESDALRKIIFHRPTYSWFESAYLFKAIHILIEELLKEGYSVVLDSTNLSERNRKKLYNIADKANVKLILVRIKASARIVYQRLNERVDLHAGYSDADWKIYQQMKRKEEAIQRKHIVVDTGKDITPVLEQIIKEVKDQKE